MRVAMIPARLGSKRVPRKNLRLLGGKPLLAWVTETARDCGLFDAVYVNTEAVAIAELAASLGVKVYVRDAALATDAATSEDFVADFLRRVPCDEVYQVTPTSPFLTADDLNAAVALMDDDEDTVVSVRAVRAECVYLDRAVNFDPCAAMPPSQDLKPVYAYCNGIFAWRRDAFLGRIGKTGAATYGGGTAARLVLDGASAIDIDVEDDFALAEAYLRAKSDGPSLAPRYWAPSLKVECGTAVVLGADGVASVSGDIVQRMAFSLDAQLAALPLDRSAAVRLFSSPSGCATLISQMPGEGNRRHYHPDQDEWWLVLEGAYVFEVGAASHLATRGTVVRANRGQWHRITATGDGRAVRLAVSKENVEHVLHD